MINDLISRAAAIAQIKENYCYWCDHTDLCKSCETYDCIATIEQHVPAVDAVLVVRCKDCKYWVCADTVGAVRYGDCTNKQSIISKHAKPNENYFCADGERRDGDA